METSETERWHNGKMERTTAKQLVVRFLNFTKNKSFRIISEQTAAARNDATVKKNF